MNLADQNEKNFSDWYDKKKQKKGWVTVDNKIKWLKGLEQNDGYLKISSIKDLLLEISALTIDEKKQIDSLPNNLFSLRTDEFKQAHTLIQGIIQKHKKELREKIANRNLKGIRRTEYGNFKYTNFAEEYLVFLNENESRTEMNDYIDKLQTSKNLILRGAPGTGKTYLAKKIARELTEGNEEQIGFVQFHPSYDYTDFVEGLRPVLDSNGQMAFKRQNGMFRDFCQKAKEVGQVGGQDNFLESWQAFFAEVSEVELNGSYDAVKTLTGKSMHLVGYERAGMTGVTEKNSSSIFLNMDQCYKVYKGKPGVPQGGLDHYRKAVVKHLKEKFGLKEYIPSQSEESDKKFVFIIDEINRGEISKIFGELFFAIDPGYRGKKGAVTTQYANMDDSAEAFYIPENVYIIGTMNDIDRSVDTFDFAMRRRFRFVEVKAEDRLDMWKGNLSEEHIVEAEKRLTKLNEEIEKLEELNRNYHVGPSYFLTLPDLNYNYDILWKDYLAPLLEEYLRGTYDEGAKLEQLQRAYNLEGQVDEIDR